MRKILLIIGAILIIVSSITLITFAQVKTPKEESLEKIAVLENRIGALEITMAEAGLLLADIKTTVDMIREDGNPGEPTDVIIKRTITLAWDAPVINLDGTLIDDLSHFRILYGPSVGDYRKDIVTTEEKLTLELLLGDYAAVVSAIDNAGNEGGFSNPVVFTVE